jgi:PTS system mannose-specific IID component
MYCRSFFLQAVWSFERMQNIGFLFSMMPKLKSLYGKDIDKLKAGCRRYIGYFNTHPYMAPYILGYAAKEEEKIFEDDTSSLDGLERQKLQMAGPLAAIGDKMFWSMWRPLIGLIGILLFFIGIKPYYLVPVIFILLYNIPILLHKYGTLRNGYSSKNLISEGLKKINQSIFVKAFPVMGFMILGACIIMAFAKLNIINGLIFIFVTAITAFFKVYYRFSETKMFYIISILLIAGYYFNK